VTTIVLVGLMGAGKSTVGRIVAERMGCRLIDSDLTIGERTGSSVRELWERGGEATYRGLESTIVIDALAEPSPLVVAAPGGVVLDPEVRRALHAAFTVWLRGAPGTLAARVRPGDHRPLLGTDPVAALTTMSSERADLYRQVADAVVDVDGVEAHLIAERVLALFHESAATVAADDPRPERLGTKES
jgi:shikimate kinase